MDRTWARRRVVFAATGLNLGGAETQLTRLSCSLKDRGWDTRVISLLPAGHFGTVLEQAGIEVRSLGMVRGRPDLGALRRGTAMLREWRPDVVHAHLLHTHHANVFGRIAGRLAGVPVVVASVRNENFGGRARDLALRLTDPWGSITVANCQAVAEALVRRHVVPLHKLRVVPNGIALPGEGEDRPKRLATRRKLGVGGDEFLWIAVGRLEEQKDYPTLVRAFARVAGTSPHARLVIAGRGDPTELERLALSLGAAASCRFLGERDDVEDLLRASDAYVLASSWEGLPNTVMEALAVARPVVATGVGGVPELVLQGRTGLLAPARDPAALAAAMSELMAWSPDQRARAGREGRELVTTTYSLPAVIDRWEALFDGLLAGDRR